MIFFSLSSFFLLVLFFSLSALSRHLWFYFSGVTKLPHFTVYCFTSYLVNYILYFSAFLFVPSSLRVFHFYFTFPFCLLPLLFFNFYSVFIYGRILFLFKCLEEFLSTFHLTLFFFCKFLFQFKRIFLFSRSNQFLFKVFRFSIIPLIILSACFLVIFTKFNLYFHFLDRILLFGFWIALYYFLIIFFAFAANSFSYQAFLIYF